MLTTIFYRSMVNKGLLILHLIVIIMESYIPYLVLTKHRKILYLAALNTVATVLWRQSIHITFDIDGHYEPAQTEQVDLDASELCSAEFCE